MYGRAFKFTPVNRRMRSNFPGQPILIFLTRRGIEIPVSKRLLWKPAFTRRIFKSRQKSPFARHMRECAPVLNQRRHRPQNSDTQTDTQAVGNRQSEWTHPDEIPK